MAKQKAVKNKSIDKYIFKCSKCGIQVILEGDDPEFLKRTTCYNCR